MDETRLRAMVEQSTRSLKGSGGDWEDAILQLENFEEMRRLKDPTRATFYVSSGVLKASYDSLARRIDALEVEVGNLRRALTDHQLGEDHE